jgi:hypothetical protein
MRKSFICSLIVLSMLGNGVPSASFAAEGGNASQKYTIWTGVGQAVETTLVTAAGFALVRSIYGFFDGGDLLRSASYTVETHNVKNGTRTLKVVPASSTLTKEAYAATRKSMRTHGKLDLGLGAALAGFAAYDLLRDRAPQAVTDRKSKNLPQAIEKSANGSTADSASALIAL